MQTLSIRKHFKIQISGNVYNVGFRFIAMSKANEYKIFGFVRYEKDDSIYIEAEGNPTDLDALVEWCKIGPPVSKG